MAAAAGEDNSFDWSLASPARFAVALVNRKPLAKLSHIAVGVTIITERGTALGDGFLQNPDDFP